MDSRRADDLLLGVAKLVQVVDAVKDGALEGNGGVQVVLAAALIDGEAFKDEPLREARLQGADLEDGVHMQLCGAHGRQVLLHATPVDLAPARDLQAETLRAGAGLS